MHFPTYSILKNHFYYNLRLFIVWQFKANQIGGIFDAAFAFAFVINAYFLVLPKTLHVSQISVGQKLHFVLCLAQLQVSRLIFPELLFNVRGHWRVLQSSVRAIQTKFLEET